MRTFVLTAVCLVVLACGSSNTPPTKQSQADSTLAAATAPKPPADETRRFAQPNLVSTRVVASALLGKSFMPGGTIAEYQKGKSKYQMFVARAATSTEAAIKLSEWRTLLTDPAFVASFGGYFGTDANTPVFVFSKGEWIAGTVGLPRAEADAASRVLAARL